CSPVLMAAVFIFAKTFSPARLAILTSWMLGVGMMGNIIGSSPMATAAETFGWRVVMLGLAAATLLVALSIFAFVRDPETEKHEAGSLGLRGYVELLRLRALWPILPYIALCNSAAGGIRGLWAGPYLADVFGADSLLIGEVTLFMAIAMATGAFLYGPLDNIFGTRKWIALTGGAIVMLSV